MKAAVARIVTSLVVLLILCGSVTAQPSTLESRGDFSFNKVPSERVFRSLAHMLSLEIRLDPRVRADVTVQMSDVRVRALLDAMCESARCSWRVEGRTLVVDAVPGALITPGGRAVLDAVNRRVTPMQITTWTRASQVLRSVTEATVPGCQLDLPKFLDVHMAMDIKGDQLLGTLRSILGYIGVEADFRITGRLATGSNAVSGCRLSVIKRREPGSGVFAITPNGMVKLEVYGERPPSLQNSFGVHPLGGTLVEGTALGLSGDVGRRVRFAPGTIDKVAMVDSVQSFLVNGLNAEVTGLYLVASRENLAMPEQNPVRFAYREISLTVLASQTVSNDLFGDTVAREAKRLAETSGRGADAEVYLVLNLGPTRYGSARSYPVRLRLPKS